jgi:hypothetical protein
MKVENVPVESSPVLTLEGAEIERVDVKGAIVRVVIPDGSSPEEIKRQLFERGAIGVAFVVQRAVQLRAERVEGLSKIASPRERMRRYLAAEHGPAIAARDALAAEVWRIMDDEGL